MVAPYHNFLSFAQDYKYILFHVLNSFYYALIRKYSVILSWNKNNNNDVSKKKNQKQNLSSVKHEFPHENIEEAYKSRVKKKAIPAAG